MARPIIPVVDRFMQYVSPEPNSGCWLWTAAIFSDGYGGFHMQVDGTTKRLGAHRAAWTLFRGPIGTSMVLHRCDQPTCVNPDHLFLGNQQANMTDMALKMRGKRSKRGLPRGVFIQRTSNPLAAFGAAACYRGSHVYAGSFSTPNEAHAAAELLRARLYVEPTK